MSHATDSYDDDDGCAVSRRYINVCNSDVFSVANMYLVHLKLCVVCTNGRRYNIYIYIYISLFAHTSYKVVHRKCNCIQTEYIKI